MAKKDRRQIFKDLKAGEVAPLYYLHGDDSYMLDSAVTAVIEAALPDGTNEFNFQKFRGNDATAEAIRSAAETLPFMTRRRAVVVRDVQAMPLDQLDALSEYFADPAPTTVLVMAAFTAAKKLDGRSAAVKRLRAGAREYEFTEFREREVGPFVSSKAKGLGLHFDRDAVAYLVEALGTDLAMIMSALQKIDLYVGLERRDVGVDDVRAVVSDTRVKSVFDLADAVGSRRLADAIKILDRMLVAGESAIGITSMLARHFRIVAKLHDPDVKSLSNDATATAVGAPGFFLSSYVADARRFRRAEVENIRRQLVETDLALKSSRLSDRVVMEALLLEICRRGEAAA